ncbi:MAG: ribokinase [Spirochaetaceae bacterium]|jgi:ribokinase|nr:ribokinase [Spirochaetaceae bacterium]
MYKADVIVLNHLGGGTTVRVHHLPAVGETVMGFDWKICRDVAKGGNTAIALSRLGLRVAIISKVGNDTAGRRDKQWLDDESVDTSAVFMSDDVSTGQGIMLIDDKGRNMIVTGESSTKMLSQDEVKTSLENFRSPKFFVSGFEIAPSLALDAAKFAKSKGLKTVLNPSPVAPLPCIDYIDYLFVNELEARLLLDINVDDNVDPKILCKQLHERYHACCTIVTLGEKGSAAYTTDQKDAYHFYPAIEVNAVDTAGAGDGFLAAVVYSLVNGKPIQEALDWANRYAAYTVTKSGGFDAYPTLEQLHYFTGKA